MEVTTRSNERITAEIVKKIYNLLSTHIEAGDITEQDIDDIFDDASFEIYLDYYDPGEL